MPLETLAPLIVGGINNRQNQVNNLMNMMFQSMTNRSQMRYNTKMYERQRADSLADWNMMNEYNSPAAQMQRFRDAGLNPNLIYGNSNNEMATVRSSSVESYNPKAPQFDTNNDMQSVLTNMYNLDARQAQTDNVREQTKLLRIDQINKTIETLLKQREVTGKDLDNELKALNLQLQNELYDTTVGQARSNKEKTDVEINNLQQENIRRWIEQGLSIEKIGQEILESQARIELNPYTKREIEARIKNLAQEYKLKEFDEALQANGISRNSPWYAKFLGQLFGPSKSDIRQGESYYDWIKRKLKEAGHK